MFPSPGIMGFPALKGFTITFISAKYQKQFVGPVPFVNALVIETIKLAMKGDEYCVACTPIKSLLGCIDPRQPVVSYI
jgi:hypothetical protein